MKILYTGLSMLITASAFANVPVENEKLNIIYDAIKIQSAIDRPNLEILPLVCGVSSCNANLIENGMSSGSLSLSGEINDKNNVTKSVIVIYNQLGTQIEKSFLIRLSNGEFKNYDKEGLADYAFENDHFLPKREKRNAAGAAAAWGAAIIGAIGASQGFDHLVEKWNSPGGPQQGVNWFINQYQQTSQNWNAMQQQQQYINRMNQEIRQQMLNNNRNRN